MLRFSPAFADLRSCCSTLTSTKRQRAHQQEQTQEDVRATSRHAETPPSRTPSPVPGQEEQSSSSKGIKDHPKQVTEAAVQLPEPKCIFPAGGGSQQRFSQLFLIPCPSPQVGPRLQHVRAGLEHGVSEPSGVLSTPAMPGGSIIAFFFVS